LKQTVLVKETFPALIIAAAIIIRIPQQFKRYFADKINGRNVGEAVSVEMVIVSIL
jgi:hypothetical protein